MKRLLISVKFIILLLTHIVQGAYFVGFSAFMGKTWNINEAKDWVVTNSKCKSTQYSVTVCNGYQILGGYECLASQASISRDFILPHHWSILIKVSFWLIDSWDDESLIMKLGKLEITEKRSHSPTDQDLCGARGNYWGLNAPAYYDRKYDKELKNDPHFERSVKAYFSSNLDGTPDDESFGISNFQLLIDPCNPTCNKCLNGPEAFKCLNCWDNATFYKYSDDYQMCECSKDEFYMGLKGESCPDKSRSCAVTFKEQGFCKCNDGYYTVSKDVPCNSPVCTECIKCDATCTLCSGSGPSSCITCAKNLYKQTYSSPDVANTHPNYGKTICQANCLNDSYYKDTSKLQCVKCDTQCKSCIGPLQAECASCPDGYFLDGTDIGGGVVAGFCVTKCSQGYYKDTVNKRCLRCNTDCIDCKDDQPNFCTECKKKLHLQNGKCYVNCPDGFWNNTPIKMCQPCNAKCSTCLENADSCTSCIASFYYYKGDCLNNTCPTGYYKLKNASTNKNTCEKCNSQCLTCTSGTSNDCLSCDPAIGFLRGTQCTVCASNQYGNSKDQTCYQCNPKCATCDGPSDSECRSCMGSLLYFNKQCSDSCPDSTYADTQNQTCQPCHDTCLTCSQKNSNNCKTCRKGRFLKNFVCEEQCNPIGEYPDILNNVCATCNGECVRCKDGTNKGCLQCPGNKYLQSNSCVDSCLSNLFGMISTRECLDKCPQGFYGDKATKSCLTCNPLCPICNDGGLNNCFKCAQPLFLDGLFCNDRCPPAFYGDINDRLCKKCDSKCQECSSGSINDCTKCSSSQFLGGTTCYAKCPNRQYGDMMSMTCVAECPLGTYGNEDERICKACHSNCSQCYGASYSQCKKCNIGFYNLNGTCDHCPIGYYSQDLARTCEKCFENCDECVGGSPSDCLQCVQGQFYIKEKKMCASSCPSPYYSEDNNPDCVMNCSHSNQYPNSITRRCDICHNACLRCIGPSDEQCLECSPNHLHLASLLYCTKKCPDGYFDNIVTWTCELCDKSCLTCYGGQIDQCSSCKEPSIFYENQCKNDCPEDLFRDEDRMMCVTDCTTFKQNRFNNIINHKCQNCHSSCLLCTGSTNKECQKCTSSYLKLGESCVETCPSGFYAKYKSNDQNSTKPTNKLQQPEDDCLKCHQNCQDCYGATEKQCRTCTKGLFLYTKTIDNSQQVMEQSCLITCPDSYVQNEVTMTCDNCPPYSYFENGQCLDCHFSCLKCKGPQQNDCLQCTDTRSVAQAGEPVYGECNCKSDFMESYGQECLKVSTGVKSASRSIVVTAITSASCSLITGLIGTSVFSFHQVIEISQFISTLRYTNITFPLNINSILESIATDQANKLLQKKTDPPSTLSSRSSENRNLMIKEELEYIKERDAAPQLWQRYIFTLVVNVLSWLVVLMVNTSVAHMKIKYDDQRIIEKIRIAIQYTLPIQVFIRTSQESIQFIFLSFSYSSSLDFFGWLNCIYMTLTGLAVIAIIIRGSFLAVKKKEKENASDEDEYQMIVKKNKVYPHPLRSLWYLFKDDKLSRNYYAVMLGVKLMYVIGSSVTDLTVTEQLVIMMLSKIIFCIYLIALKPYKNACYNYMNIFNEVLSAILPLTTLFMSNATHTQYTLYGWLLIVQIIILYAVNFIFAVFELLLMLKHILTNKNQDKNKLVQVNSDKHSIYNHSSLEFGMFQKPHFNSNKEFSKLKKDIENHDKIGNHSRDISVRESLSNNNVTKLQVIQINGNNNNNNNLPLYQGIGDSSCQSIKQDDQMDEYNNNQSISKRDAEDFNMSNLKDQSMIKDENSQFNQSADINGFPLQVYGKQLEDNQLNSSLKRKKKNKQNYSISENIETNLSANLENLNQNNEQSSISQGKDVKKDNQNIAENKKNLIIDENRKNQNIGEKIEKLNTLLQNGNNVSPKKVSQRNDLDIIQIIQQQSVVQIKRQKGSPQKINRNNLIKSDSKDSLDDQINDIYGDKSTYSNYSQKKECKKLDMINEDKKETLITENQDVEFNQINNGKNYLNSKSNFKSAQKQEQKQNVRNNITHSAPTTQNLSNSKNNVIDAKQEVDTDKKQTYESSQPQNKNTLFEGPGIFKISRIIQQNTRSNQNSPYKKQKLNIIDCASQQDKLLDDQDKSKSILEYIRLKANKTKDQKNI